MLVVVDANVICSGMLAMGKTIDLLFSDGLEPVAAELLFLEFEEHMPEIMARSKLSEKEFGAVLSLLKKRVKIIPSLEFEDKLEEADKALFPHTKDTEYCAECKAFAQFV